jgi:hypothetical protein
MAIAGTSTSMEFSMKTPVAISAVLWTAMLAAPAMAQENNSLRVNAIYIEQAPGLLVEPRIARGAAGPYVAEVRRQSADGKIDTHFIRLPAGSRVQVGDQLGAQESRDLSSRLPKGPSRIDSRPSAAVDCIPVVAGR